jgi:hypothetical protein
MDDTTYIVRVYEVNKKLPEWEQPRGLIQKLFQHKQDTEPMTMLYQNTVHVQELKPGDKVNITIDFPSIVKDC